MASWEVFDESLPLLGATYGKAGVRMVAIGLKDGELAVYSPGKRGDEARRELEKYGKVTFLVAPNSYHNAGLAEWQAAYPEAVVVANPQAHARLKKQVPSLSRVDDLADLERKLPDGVRVFGPPMAKQGEVFFGVSRGDVSALVVCDAFVNMERVGVGPWLIGFRAQLIANPLFKRLFLKNKAEYKSWMLAELEAHPPNLFIPSHGQVMRGARVAESLRAATRAA